MKATEMKLGKGVRGITVIGLIVAFIALAACQTKDQAKDVNIPITGANQSPSYQENPELLLHEIWPDMQPSTIPVTGANPSAVYQENPELLLHEIWPDMQPSTIPVTGANPSAVYQENPELLLHEIWPDMQPQR